MAEPSRPACASDSTAGSPVNGGKPGRPLQTFMLYAAGGRVFASNVRQKLIDLGSLSGLDGDFSYELDGSHDAGEGLASAGEALKAIARRLSFLYLDGQFTALADLHGPDGPNLEHAAQLELTLDELGQGEAAIDTGV